MTYRDSTGPIAMTSAPLDMPSSDILAFVLQRLRQRQQALLIAAAVIVFIGFLIGAIALFQPGATPTDVRLVWGFLLGVVAVGGAIALVALIRLAPQQAPLYRLLKDNPQAIASVYLDVKFFRGHPQEFMVLRTADPQHTYVITGIQRFGVPALVQTLRHRCPRRGLAAAPPSNTATLSPSLHRCSKNNILLPVSYSAR